MMSTTARYPIKPKTLSLLEICQSISDFRQQHPPPSVASYQYHVTPNTSQILTRRLYLHTLTIKPNPNKQQIPKTLSTNLSSIDGESPRQTTQSEKSRENTREKKKPSQPNLAIFSSSLPLITRLNTKPETRHAYRQRGSLQTDEDTNSENDISTTANSLRVPSLTGVNRGTLASTGSKCTRPSCLVNHQKLYPKPIRQRKINAWNHLDQTLERPIPMDPPTTPLIHMSNYNFDHEEISDPYSNYHSIQQIRIYKRNPMQRPFLDVDHEYDDYLCMEE